MGEPLKDKGFGVIEKINDKELLIDKSKNNLFHREAIKSAVEYLRDSACMKRGCKYRTEKSKIKVTVFKDRCPACRKIDEAFPDLQNVTKGGR